MRVVYLDQDDLHFAFQIVREVPYAKDEQTPAYESQSAGVEQVLGVLERMRFDLYRSIHEKAAMLFIAVAKGHYFHNGNKRLAVALLWGFYVYNSFRHRDLSSAELHSLLTSSFGETSFSDLKELSVTEDALYNLAFLVVQSKSKLSMSEDGLKRAVEKFLSGFFKKEK